jgi:hypothetical protein
MVWIIYLPIMLVALFVGYQTASGPRSPEVSAIEEVKANQHSRKKLFEAMAISVSRQRAVASVVRISSKDILSEEDGLLLSFVDKKDPLQVIIGDMLIMGRHGKDDPAANASIREKLKAHPAAGLKAIRAMIQSMPFNQFPVEKAALMALAIEAGVGDPEEMKQLALDTLNKDIAPARLSPDKAVSEEQKNSSYSTTKESFLPTISYEAYLRSTSDVQEALSETVKVLEVQQDHAVRNSIVQLFNQKYPDQDKELQARVTENKIDVHLYKQREDEASFLAKEEKLKSEYQAKVESGVIKPEQDGSNQ